MTNLIVSQILRPFKLADKPYFGCRCERCFWQGSSKDTDCSFNGIDYDDPKCPLCADGGGWSELVDFDPTWWNPFFFFLHWTLGQYRLRKDKRDFDAWVEQMAQGENYADTSRE